MLDKPRYWDLFQKIEAKIFFIWHQEDKTPEIIWGEISLYQQLSLSLFILVNSTNYYALMQWPHKHSLYVIRKATLKKKNFYFVLGFSQLTNVVWEFQVNSEGFSHTYVCMYPFPLKPLSHPDCHITEQSSLCCTLGTYWLSILNIAVCTCPSQSP